MYGVEKHGGLTCTCSLEEDPGALVRAGVCWLEKAPGPGLLQMKLPPFHLLRWLLAEHGWTRG